MADLLSNIKEFGPFEGIKETALDFVGQGEKAVPARFKVVDENGEKTETTNASSGKIYKTPTGFSNSRSYAFLSQGENGRLTLNYSSDLKDSDEFKKQYLENSTFQEIISMYNANPKASTVITATDADGNTKDVTLGDMVKNYDEALGQFAKAYEGYSSIRDLYQRNANLSLTDDEITVLSNTLSKKNDSKSNTKVIFIPDSWNSIYNFKGLSSWDDNSRTVSAKDFYDVFNTNKENGIGQDRLDDLKRMVDAEISVAMTMTDHVDDEGNPISEEALDEKKDRLARAVQAYNIINGDEPDRSILQHTGLFFESAGIVIGNFFTRGMSNFTTLYATVIDKTNYTIQMLNAGGDFGDVTDMFATADKEEAKTILAGAVSEDIDSGDLNPYTAREYINGILVNSAEMSDIDKVKAEYKAALVSHGLLTNSQEIEDLYDKIEAGDKEVDRLTAMSAAAKAGNLTANIAIIAVEVAMANKAGGAFGSVLSGSKSRVLSALSSGMSKTALGYRLTQVAGLGGKTFGFLGNVSVQSLFDSLMLENPRDLRNTLMGMDDESSKQVCKGILDNLVWNVGGEIIGIGASKGAGAFLETRPGRFLNTRVAQGAARIERIKLKGQLKFANTKLAKFLSKPLFRRAATTQELLETATRSAGRLGIETAPKSLEEYNQLVMKKRIEKVGEVIDARKGTEYISNFETREITQAATKTEAIEGKLVERQQFENLVTRVGSGAKAEVQEMFSDTEIRETYSAKMEAAQAVNKATGFKDYDPAKGKIFSQDVSNYLADRYTAETLTRQSAALAERGKSLSKAQQEQLAAALSRIASFEASGVSPKALQALNQYHILRQQFNKALTDYAYNNGLISKARYERLAKTGYFGEDDEFYLKQIALPGGKKSGELTEEEFAEIAQRFGREVMDANSGTDLYKASDEWTKDYHRGDGANVDYMDPELVDALRINALAQAKQARDWYTALYSTKTPGRIIDTEGKPVTKAQVKKTMSEARHVSDEAITKILSEDLATLNAGVATKSTIGEQYRQVFRAQERLNKANASIAKKLGVLDEKQISGNVIKLDNDVASGLYEKATATGAIVAPEIKSFTSSQALSDMFYGLSEANQKKILKVCGLDSIEQKGAVREWQKAYRSTNIVDDIQKQALSEAIADGRITGDLLNETRESVIANSISSLTEKQAAALEKQMGRRVELEELVKQIEEGTDGLTLASQSLADYVIGKAMDDLKASSLASYIDATSKSYGELGDIPYRYLALNGLLETDKTGKLVLSRLFKKNFNEKYAREFVQNAKIEGNLTGSMMLDARNQALDRIEEYVIDEWAKEHRALLDAGAEDLIDANKYYDAIKYDMEQLVGKINSPTVIQTLNKEGDLELVEVSPLVADLYKYRPYKSYDDSIIRDISRWARLGNTSFSARSFFNQSIRDPIDSFIRGNLRHSVTTNAEELAKMHGDKIVEYLQESMSEAGWAKFTEGLTDSEIKLKAAREMTTGFAGAGSFAGDITETKFYAEGLRSAKAAKKGLPIEALPDYQALQKKAKGRLLDFAERHAPFNKLNDFRETSLRKANYMSAFNDALRGGKTISQARQVAEFVSRNATTNFSNTFMWGNYICNNVPFLAAAINGSASFWRLVAMDPIGVMSRVISAGVALMAITVGSAQTLEDRQTLRNVPDYVKSENAVFVYDGEVFKIPIPQEVAGLLAPFRQAAEKAVGDENRSWVELLWNDALSISPISLDGFSTEDQTKLTKNQSIIDRLSREAQVLISQVCPPVVQSAIMAYTGVDPFTGQDIDKSYTIYDDEGNPQIMTYSQSEFAKWLSNITKGTKFEMSADMAEATIEQAIGTGFLDVLDGFTSFAEAVLGGKNAEGEDMSIIDAVAKSTGDVVEKASKSVYVPGYSVKDPYDRDFKQIIRELEKEKNSMLSSGSSYTSLVKQLGMLNSSADNYESQKKNLTRQALQEVEDFRLKALNLVNTYAAHYGSTYDPSKFGSVLSLLMFDTPTSIPLSAKEFDQASEAYWSSRQQAYQTMVDLGFASTNDMSMLGYAKRDKQTGEVSIKFSSPTAILNAKNATWNSYGDAVGAEIDAAIEVAGINRSDMFDGYNEAKKMGKDAVKEYKKAWNAKVVKAIAPVVNRYGANTALENRLVQRTLEDYIFISNPYKKEAYLKEIFGVKD